MYSFTYSSQIEARSSRLLLCIIEPQVVLGMKFYYLEQERKEAMPVYRGLYDTLKPTWPRNVLHASISIFESYLNFLIDSDFWSFQEFKTKITEEEPKCFLLWFMHHQPTCQLSLVAESLLQAVIKEAERVQLESQISG